MKRLYLASRSPRRRELLGEAGIPFELIDVDVDETNTGESEPRGIAMELAERKARAGAERVSDGRVLGADTIVVLGSNVLGKPSDRADARSMLRGLSSGTHSVMTGVCLLDVTSGAVLTEVAETRVTMREMTEREISDYVDTGESDDKAGAYAIQERGDQFVSAIDGSYSNVVGLPVKVVAEMISRMEAMG